MIRKLLVVVTLLIFFGGCSKALQDDRLSIPQTHYTGSQLRTDGYYYVSLLNNTHIRAYLLYRNGILMHAGSYPNSSLQEIESDLLSAEWLPVIKDAKYMWGRFLISEDSIQFERWYPSEPPMKAIVHAGKILNDTTFLIVESYRMKNGKKTETDSDRNEVYHFKQFSPKPDSTNRFVQ